MRIVILHIYPCVYYYILLCNKVKYTNINTILFGDYQSFLYLCNVIRGLLLEPALGLLLLCVCVSYKLNSTKNCLPYPKGIKITIYHKSYIRTLTMIDVIQMEGVYMLLYTDYKVRQLIRLRTKVSTLSYNQ